MIELKRLNGEIYYLNPLLIETVEARPDVVITLITGKKLVVANTLDEVLAAFQSAMRLFTPTQVAWEVFKNTRHES
ncbi:MAG: flagellar FlbD family protein [Candidatus Carbobacillus altaicus]|uniref:Flagellar protein FlbD n=1 Tax=Candidatus Carbonibacillus altaicus TaxID=2163959 RepID=A0A2R6Y4V3_9BACL|nr:flagellar FlbD family protein [Candidatus Carbobacillus altaicus]PTQ57719.1 MAG: hypothetical protein BSOLF_0914 [Candidatus Carbobacillus altaicus]